MYRFEIFFETIIILSKIQLRIVEKMDDGSNKYPLPSFTPINVTEN